LAVLAASGLQLGVTRTGQHAWGGSVTNTPARQFYPIQAAGSRTPSCESL